MIDILKALFTWKRWITWSCCTQHTLYLQSALNIPVLPTETLDYASLDHQCCSLENIEFSPLPSPHPVQQQWQEIAGPSALAVPTHLANILVYFDDFSAMKHVSYCNAWFSSSHHGIFFLSTTNTTDLNAIEHVPILHWSIRIHIWVRNTVFCSGKGHAHRHPLCSQSRQSSGTKNISTDRKTARHCECEFPPKPPVTRTLSISLESILALLSVDYIINNY